MSAKSKSPVVPNRSSKRLSPSQSLWNEIVGPEERRCLPAIRLPTNQIVLQRYKTIKNVLPMSSSVRDVARKICAEILDVWSKANIPTKSEKSCIQIILRLVKSWTTFCQKSKYTQPGSAKYDDFKRFLSELCDIAYGNEEELKEKMRSTRLPTWERDYEFYLNQKAGNTLDIMDGCDSELQKRRRRKAIDDEKKLSRVQKEAARKKDIGAIPAALGKPSSDDEVDSNEAENHTDGDNKNDDPDVNISKRQQWNMRKQPDTITLQLPRKGLAKILTPSSARYRRIRILSIRTGPCHS